MNNLDNIPLKLAHLPHFLNKHSANSCSTLHDGISIVYRNGVATIAIMLSQHGRPSQTARMTPDWLFLIVDCECVT